MSANIYSKIYSIYIIRNIINNMIYVGFSDDPERRFKKHKQCAIRGSRACLHRSMRDFGIENFVLEIVYQSWDFEDCLKIMEPYFIRKYRSFGPAGYNSTFGGEGTIGYKYTEEQRKRMSVKRTGRIPWNKGIPMSEKAKQKNRETHLGTKNFNFGKPKSEETRKKISRGNTGKIRTVEMNQKNRNAKIGIQKSEDHKRKISESHLGIRPSDEARKKQSIARKEYWRRKKESSL